ncbi:fungal-specific transcription factor domain-containing protein [Aspergillus multicolor]|uniref:Zn(II)2Cys6 transcription factor n=1 Tax=Aspergillus multicolor TaxID=41759 RepID=UPI003CCD6821
MGLVHKACDRCRARKSRCQLADSPTEVACDYCHSRNLPCHFSYQKRRHRRNPDVIAHPPTHPPAALSLPAPAAVETALQAGSGFPGLYIDYLLERNPIGKPCGATSNDQLTTLLGPSPNISFFPAKRVRAISQRLGHTKLESLLEAIRTVIAAKLKSSSSPAGAVADGYFPRDVDTGHTQHAPVTEYIETYMEQVHPFFPFVDRSQFEKRALAPTITQDLAADKAWACLYYAVVAVGCQHSDGGGYEARTGASWAFFERSMSLCRDIGFLRGSLTYLQAFMALALFCQAISGFGLESAILAEAATLAQSLGINRLGPASDTAARTFWVLYYMEKTSCFASGKVPTLQDSHISCPLPTSGLWTFSDHDWLTSFLRFARLASKIHSRLLAITSVPRPWAIRCAAITKLQAELEAWRLSIPARFRPGEPLRPRLLLEPHAVAIALRTQYYYHSACLTLTWTLLHCENEPTDANTTHPLTLKTELMQTARSVLELTSYIEISPSTPLWILVLTPLSALMVLFDLVIHNPSHAETSLNLALLDVASGHFSRIEYASTGVLPGSLISEFAHLARQYVADIRHNARPVTAAAAASAAAATYPASNLYTGSSSSSGFHLTLPPHPLHRGARSSPVPGEGNETRTKPSASASAPECPYQQTHTNTEAANCVPNGSEQQGVPQDGADGTGGNESTATASSYLPFALPLPLPLPLPNTSAVPGYGSQGQGRDQDPDEMLSGLPDVDAAMQDELQFMGVDLMGLFDLSYS